VALNIKNAEVVEMIRRLAKERGVDMTEAIRGAVERDLRFSEVAVAARLRKMRAISSRVAALPTLDDRPLEEILGYDEHGLPS
jgi:antitoxin VapB